MRNELLEKCLPFLGVQVQIFGSDSEFGWSVGLVVTGITPICMQALAVQNS